MFAEYLGTKVNHLNAEKKAELFAAMQEGNEHYWEASATKDTVRSIIRDADPDHDSRGGSYSLRLNLNPAVRPNGADHQWRKEPPM